MCIAILILIIFGLSYAISLVGGFIVYEVVIDKENVYKDFFSDKYPHHVNNISREYVDDLIVFSLLFPIYNIYLFAQIVGYFIKYGRRKNQYKSEI